jgi:broad specificity phosphatase PhoE
MKKIYFVRHGESEANAAGITAGGGLDVDLTENGKHQAQKIGEELKGKKIDLIVSSPMKRAYNTSVIVAQTIGYNPGNIIVNKLFTERHLGNLTGTKNELMKTYYDAGMLSPSVETTDALYKRIVEGLEWLKSLEADKIILISHGGPGRMIRVIYQQEKHSQINSLDRIGNAEILELAL